MINVYKNYQQKLHAKNNSTLDSIPYSYMNLPTSSHKKDARQGDFLADSFLSHWTVCLHTKVKELCLSYYLIIAEKTVDSYLSQDFRAMWNTNSLVQDLNLIRHAHFLRHSLLVKVNICKYIIALTAITATLLMLIVQ